MVLLSGSLRVLERGSAGDELEDSGGGGEVAAAAAASALRRRKLADARAAKEKAQSLSAVLAAAAQKVC